MVQDVCRVTAFYFHLNDSLFVNSKLCRMKKVLHMLAVLLCISLVSNAQTTYYWVGGSGSQTTTGTSAISWSAASWNTAQDGTGTQRTASAGNDILIFDGNAAGLVSKTIYIKDMPVRDSVGQLKLINGVKVYSLLIAATSASPGTVTFGSTYGGVTVGVTGTGTTFLDSLKKGDYIYTSAVSDYTRMAEVLNVTSNTDLTIASDASVANTGTSVTYYRANAMYIKGNPGLTIDAGCTWGLGISVGGSSQLGPYVIALQPGATGTINGDFSFLSRGNGARLVAQDPGSLVFGSGSNCNVSISGGKFYMLGNTCGAGSAASTNFAFNTGTPAIVFQAGSSYKQGTLQTNTPFGVSHVATSPLVYSPAVSFLPNSNYYFTYTNGYQPYFFSNGATFGNLIWNSTATPGSTSTTTFFLNPARMDTLQILAMGTPASPTNAGKIPLYGDYINNSTTTCNFGTMLFAGSGTTQKISGTNTAAPIGSLIINDNANVQLLRNVTVVTAASVLGKLDVGTYTITGSGTPTFANNNALNKTYDKPSGSLLPGGVYATSGSKAINVNGISTILVGSTVTSSSHPTIFPAGTFVVSYGGSGNYTLSNAATVSADSTSTPTLSLTFTSTAGTITTANTGGLNASLPSFTTYNFNNATNYVFNGTSAQVTGALLPATLNNLTTSNASGVSLSGAVTVNGTLSITTGALTTGSNNLSLGTTSLNNTIGPLGSLSITGGSTDFAGKALTIQSTSAGTGRIAAILGDNVTTGLLNAGNVTTQVYIPGGRRTNRFLGHPFSTALTMASLIDNIYITGPDASFDATTTGNPSAFWFKNSNQTWTAFTSTSDASWTQYTGMRALVRGNRSQPTSLTGGNPTPNAVTLDMTGALNTGAQTIAVPTGYSVVSNPYPSPVDIGTRLNATANIGASYYVWDANAGPSAGAYVTKTVSATPYSLAMNGAFVVNPASATSINFVEADKQATASANLFRTTGRSGLLELQVLYNDYPADNMLVRFNQSSIAAKDVLDGDKLANPEVNLYALSADNKKLSLDTRPFTDSSIIPLGLTATKANSFKIKVSDKGLDEEIYLKDKFLNTITKLELGTEYPFEVTAVAASQGDSRFELMMKLAPVLPAMVPTFSIKLSPNPATDVLTVSFTNAEQLSTSISITNSAGQLMKSVDAGNAQFGQIKINIKSLAKGTYFVTLNSGKERKTANLQVQ